MKRACFQVWDDESNASTSVKSLVSSGVLRQDLIKRLILPPTGPSDLSGSSTEVKHDRSVKNSRHARSMFILMILIKALMFSPENRWSSAGVQAASPLVRSFSCREGLLFKKKQMW